jgi:hypothetical protein
MADITKRPESHTTALKHFFVGNKDKRKQLQATTIYWCFQK